MAHKSCNSMAFSLLWWCGTRAGQYRLHFARATEGGSTETAGVPRSVDLESHAARHLSSFSGTSVSSWFLSNSIGGQTSCWRELLRKTSGRFGGTCANKNHWAIVSTDKWPDKRVENSIDSICIMDVATTKSRLQGKMVNVIRSFSITGSFLDRIGNRTDARTIYTHYRIFFSSNYLG